MAKKIVNYTDELKKSKYYGDAQIVAAQGKDKNYLALFKVLQGFDKGGRARYFYELEYRWLSIDCSKADDEAYACVMGREVQYYSSRDLNKINKNILMGKANLFDSFQLF